MVVLDRQTDIWHERQDRGERAYLTHHSTLPALFNVLSKPKTPPPVMGWGLEFHIDISVYQKKRTKKIGIDE